MTFWAWLANIGPGWPSERQWVSILTWVLAVGMLVMTIDRPELWKEELFKTLITVVLVSGFVNMILSFHFAANRNDEVKAENTGRAFSAIEAAAKASSTSSSADEVHVEGENVTVEQRPSGA